MKKKIFAVVVISILVNFISACQKSPLTAKADIFNLKGEKIGLALLDERPDGVGIKLKINSLAPGIHAFHLHEKGHFQPPNFKEAGGHFNPMSKEHGMKNPKGHHAGDLPNLEVKNDGVVDIDVMAKNVTLQKGKMNSLLKEGGTSLIIHEKPDDNVTNPAGNAGDRIAGGVIVETK